MKNQIYSTLTILLVIGAVLTQGPPGNGNMRPPEGQGQQGGRRPSYNRDYRSNRYPQGNGRFQGPPRGGSQQYGGQGQYNQQGGRPQGPPSGGQGQYNQQGPPSGGPPSGGPPSGGQGGQQSRNHFNGEGDPRPGRGGNQNQQRSQYPTEKPSRPDYGRQGQGQPGRGGRQQYEGRQPMPQSKNPKPLNFNTKLDQGDSQQYANPQRSRGIRREGQRDQYNPNDDRHQSRTRIDLRNQTQRWSKRFDQMKKAKNNRSFTSLSRRKTDPNFPSYPRHSTDAKTQSQLSEGQKLFEKCMSSCLSANSLRTCDYLCRPIQNLTNFQPGSALEKEGIDRANQIIKEISELSEAIHRDQAADRDVKIVKRGDDTPPPTEDDPRAQDDERDQGREPARGEGREEGAPPIPEEIPVRP